MTTRTSKIFIRLFSSLLIVVAVKTILACGYDDSPDEGISVFAPEIVQQPAKAPFFLSPHVYYNMDKFGIPETIPTLTDRNTADWVSFFENKISASDIEWLLYGSTTNQLETLKKSPGNKKLKTDTLNQAVAGILKKHKNNRDILDYIIFAKTSEKYFNPSPYSWNAVVYDSTAIQPLIPLCMERFEHVRSRFLKQRYGFQVTRALSVSGRHADCIRFFDEVFIPSPDASGMYYRSLGYKARSLYKLEEYSLANYLYACLYDSDPCQRYMAYQSFHPQEEADWKATLALAKTTAEKEALWELFGLYAEPARAMKEIYTLNPQSNSLPLLLVRSVNIAEEQLLLNPSRGSVDFYFEEYVEGRPAEESQYYRYRLNPTDTIFLHSLAGIINRVVAEKKTGKPAIWLLSGAYISLLTGDYPAASDMLSKSSVNNNDSLLLGQAAIIEGILAVRKLNTIDAAAEKDIYRYIQNISSFMQPELRKNNALRYIMSRLSLVYGKQNDRLKKELAYPQGQPYYQASERVQQMISFMKRSDHGPMEKYMIDRYPVTLTEMYNIKAAAYMYEYNFIAAVQEFEKVKDGGVTELEANPFTIHIVDCHDCDRYAIKKSTYSKYSFAKKMVELKAKGDSDPDAESRAQNYFLYANGIYNMTWYGNSSMVHGTRVSMDDYSSVVYGKNPALRSSNFFKCREALAFYRKAFALSRNREFKAKCTWMCAKCEHNLWLDDRKEDSRDDFVSGKYFEQIKTSFSDTRYYKEVIGECGYFCTYVTRSDSCKRNR